MSGVRIEPLLHLAQLSPLLADAALDGRRMVSRLASDYRDGSNRFDRAGECLVVAVAAGLVRGVCGLNIDAFAGDDSIGRIRRMYVAVSYRRQGVGMLLLRDIEARASRQFATLHLRTHDSSAAAFYERLGYRRVSGDSHCTHCRELV